MLSRDLSRPLLALALLAALACAPAEAPPATTAPPDVYQLRGVVRQLPDPARPGSALYVHHEAVPGFKSSDGEVVGMESMAMPFEVADDALLAGLAAGDKVAFELEVRWEGENPLRITELEKLPHDTRLSFEEDAATEADAAGDAADEAGDGESGAHP